MHDDNMFTYFEKLVKYKNIIQKMIMVSLELIFAKKPFV